MSEKVNHLEMIQAVITRMAANSFHLKGWSVVLVSSLFALAAAKSNAEFAVLAYFPALAFWVLDGYFLDQERRFRGLYDHVRKSEEADIDFSMDTTGKSDSTWAGAAFSKTLLIFHGVIIASIVVVMLVLKSP